MWGVKKIAKEKKDDSIELCFRNETGTVGLIVRIFGKAEVTRITSYKGRFVD